jgi:hypothetical protein
MFVALAAAFAAALQMTDSIDAALSKMVRSAKLCNFRYTWVECGCGECRELIAVQKKKGSAINYAGLRP